MQRKNVQVRPSGVRTPLYVQDAIVDMHFGDGLTAPQIQRRMAADPRYKAEAPRDARTIRGIIARHRKSPQRRVVAPPWSVADADPEDARLVLPVLGWLMDWTREGSASAKRAGASMLVGPSTLNVEQAEWIVRLRTAAPDLPPRTTHSLAQAYIDRMRRGRPTVGLDAVLALELWRDAQRWLAAWVDGLTDYADATVPVPSLTEGEAQMARDRMARVKQKGQEQ